MSVWLFGRVSDKAMDKIQHLHFSYTTGYARYASVSYSLEEDGQYTAQICPDGRPEEQTVSYVVPKDVAETIITLFRKYHVGRWNGFHKVDKHILDGRSFTLSVRFDSGSTINAHGYMRWPKHYREIRAALDRLFMSIYHEKQQETEESN